MNKWIRKIDALMRLANDQRGKPEALVAREKAALILQKHPEVLSRRLSRFFAQGA